MRCSKCKSDMYFIIEGMGFFGLSTVKSFYYCDKCKRTYEFKNDKIEEKDVIYCD